MKSEPCKKTIYVDTTVPSYLFDERETIRSDIEVTRRWWREQRTKFSLWISQATIAELEAGAHPYKSQIFIAIKDLPVLPSDEKINQIAQVYVNNYLMPYGDAFHLAYVSVYQLNYLLTWDRKHLANENKSQHIGRINARLGLPSPEIITPLALFSKVGGEPTGS